MSGISMSPAAGEIGCEQSLASVTELPFGCLNCDEELRASELYCSELCRQEAEWVRYARRCRRNGRDQRPDIAEALRIRRVQLLTGACPDGLSKQNPLVRITGKYHPEVWEKAQELELRVRAEFPVRLCDSDDWQRVWRMILRKRRLLNT